MFKHYFEQVHNVEIWPIVSLSIFFIFFLCLIWYLIKEDKNHIKKMKDLPLGGENSNSINQQS